MLIAVILKYLKSVKGGFFSFECCFIYLLLVLWFLDHHILTNKMVGIYSGLCHFLKSEG